ncbi:hypothetical protein PilKf_01922 [Pillotina sp. SPG140]|jgi:hypothetical protein
MFLATAGAAWVLSQMPRVPSKSDQQTVLSTDSPAVLSAGDFNTEATLNTFKWAQNDTEKYIVAYRRTTDLQTYEAPVYIDYCDFDEETKQLICLWTAVTEATRPPVQIEMLDILGTHQPSILVRGMKGSQQTLTVFYGAAEQLTPWKKIANLAIEGTISIEKTERRPAYHNGTAPGQSFSIVARGYDPEGTTTLDSMETRYQYNPELEQYEQRASVKIAGTAIEQQKLQEVRNGGRKAGERFIDGLWSMVNQQGVKQYIFFDSKEQEIIFYDGDIEQLFNWVNGTVQANGINIATSNNRITTLKRNIFIEFESLNRIRMRVAEDVQLKMGIGTSWDGSYQRSERETEQSVPTVNASTIQAQYQGTIGKLTFSLDGSYFLVSGTTTQKGKYSFYRLNNQQVLELRPDSKPRELYTVESTEEKNLILYPIKLGSQGIQTQRGGSFTLVLQP